MTGVSRRFTCGLMLLGLVAGVVPRLALGQLPEDGVALGNGAAPLVGRVAIARSANWSPRDYQLTWTPTDAMMGPSGDMGYTWGHFDGHSKDANGNPVTTSGRYMTIWRKQPDGQWKVVLDAGANEPPTGGDCCKLPGVN